VTKIEELLGIVDQSEKIELTVMHNAVLQTMKSYQGDPTTSRKRDWDAAKHGNQEVIDRLWLKYRDQLSNIVQAAIDQHQQQLRDQADAAFALAKERPTAANRKNYKQAEKALDEYLRDQAETDGDVIYRNIPELVDALDADGWKISRSTAYEHREAAKLRLSADGTISETAANEYARNHLDRKDGTPGHLAESPQAEKTREEILRIRADRLARELKYNKDSGELISRNQVEIELAERASNLRTYQDSIARSSSGRIIKIVGGDPQKAPELVAFLLGLFRKAMDNYSRPIKGFEELEEDET
jgi:hypothetical protein